MVPPTDLPPAQLFLAHLRHIEEVAAFCCRKAGFSREEAEDFTSELKCKLISDDYAVFRKFQGKSALKTYLTVVTQRFFKDHLDQRWGKWRPCEEARRQGRIAILLDQLLNRDGYTLDEACEILLTNHHVEMSRKELIDLAGKLYRRNPPRRPEEEEGVLEDHPAQSMTPEEDLLAGEKRARGQEILKLLNQALDRRPPEDALIARMKARFKTRDIAKILGIAQKPLYPRLDKILKALREDLESHGVRPEEIERILGYLEEEDEPE